MSNKQPFSFEFSAPKTNEAAKKVKQVHAKLIKYSPDFFSVTYGAGGSTRDGTKQTVLNLAKSGSNVAPHISFGGDDAETIGALLREYKFAGIKRLVALRGDRPSGTGGSVKMFHANELVQLIRQLSGDHFHIDVAAYPEIHPESETVESEINFFKQKVEAGANSAITQYFFNADAYFRFRDLCKRQDINIPIIPGIMPITNYTGIKRFSELCGAEIPRWLEKQLQSFTTQPDALLAFGADVVTDLCQRLLRGGAPSLHFYTMNRSVPTLTILENLNS